MKQLNKRYAGGPLPDDRPGLLTYLQSFTVSPGGLFSGSAPVIPITGNGDTHCCTDGYTLVKYKKLKPLTRKAEMGAFPLLNPYGDEHEPFDMDRYLQYKGNSSCAGGSSSVNENIKVYKMTWAEHCKIRLYNDNFLHDSAALF